MKRNSFSLKALALTALLVIILNVNNSYAQKLDIEADPIAYLFKGWSLHAGYSVDSWRFSIGTFGIDVPEVFHGNDGFDSYMAGAGVSSEFFFSGYTAGLFVGANAGFMHFNIQNTDDEESATHIAYNPGVRVGYRWNTGLGKVYVTPWFSINYIVNAETLNIGNNTYSMSTWQPFPTIHIGWKF